MMNRLFFIITSLSVLFSSDLKIHESYVSNGPVKFAIIELSWKNAWHNQKNHDAVWVFMKSVFSEHRGFRHLYAKSSGHEWTNLSQNNYQIEIQVAEDGTGLMIFPKSNYRGDIHIRLKVIIDERRFGSRFRLTSGSFESYAIEMVYIPEGPFYVGDPKVDSTHAAFFKSGENGTFDGLYHIESETKEIPVGQNAGDLYYLSNNQYQGDQKGPIPSDFPKGYNAFYIMKYEPKQGEYVDFLNSLTIDDGQARANFGGKTYYRDRGSIRMSESVYYADYPNRPNNFVSWDDGMAYADWSGLRPMTEFEFTKAAHGPTKPRSKQFPWGTNSFETLQRKVSQNGNLTNLKLSESELTDRNRDQFGVSYYWVFDLAGSLWERMVSVGDEHGRAFKGTHGDGHFGDYGFASNSDWPYGWGRPAGFGFRGGGFYRHANAYHTFNPYSPTSARPFGAYKGGVRKNSYGARFVRTASTLKIMK
jgi:formylglycine-generating enzyme required for sulfatase activity